MRKSLVSALTAALVIGAAGTAFAANPFSDVPAEHWAYDAVAQLAEDGVIEGYGDGSYRGQQEITRYEMAQMIARAMAKSNNSANQAILDKLAAEFADELNNLGVRIAALEKKVDNVKFYGELRYTGRRHKTSATNDSWKTQQNRGELRLKSDATVNKNWKAKAAWYYRTDNKTSSNATLITKWIYAQGKYGNTTIDLGKYDGAEPVTEGMLWDDVYTGIRFSFGKQTKLTAEVARFGVDELGAGVVADMQGASLMHYGKKLTAGAAYYHFEHGNGFGFNGKDKSNIWAACLGVRPNKNFRLYGAYAKNTEYDKTIAKKGDKGDTGYIVQLDYKGASLGKPGSWGMYVAYKHIGNAVATPLTTYDIAWGDHKGVEVAGAVTLEKNIRLHLGYFTGKSITDDTDVDIVWSRLRFFF